MKLFRLLTGVILIGLSSLCPAQTACRTVYSESQFSSKTLYPDVSLKMIFQLSDISQTADFQRGPRMKAAWRRYKNTPGPQSVLIDLGDPNLFNPSPLLNSYNAKIKYSKYDEVTALLRQGDRVKLGDRIYTLGEFLGAGNATHIYANADDPTTAIRIPYLVSRVIEANLLPAKKVLLYKPASFWRDPKVRTLLAWFFNHLQKEINQLPQSAKLQDLDAYGRLAITERVNGSEAGSDFIIPLLTAGGLNSANRTSLLAYPGSFWSRLVQLNHFTPSSKWPAETVRKMNLLLTAMVANGDAIQDGSQYQIKASRTRQYLSMSGFSSGSLLISKR